MNNPLTLQKFIPEQTIQSYLDALLQDAAAELELSEVVASPAVQAPASDLAPPALVPADVAPVLKTTPALAKVPSVEMEDEWQAVAEHDAKEAEPPAAQPDRSWREQPFEALLFEVGGLKLAVPLVSLGTIHSLDAEITPLFGQPDWFLGILPTIGGNLKVLDTARWVMPERYCPELKNNLRFVISVQGYDWGMAVHGVSKSIKLAPEQVKWRSQDGKRPWLAGTVIEHMCALLDVSALADLLIAGAWRETPGKPVAKAPRRQ